MNIQSFAEAVRLAWPEVTESARRIARASRGWIDRHPGIVAGVSIGYGMGLWVERVPGVIQSIGPTPRILGALGGALVGYLVEEALKEVQAEDCATTTASALRSEDYGGSRSII